MPDESAAIPEFLAETTRLLGRLNRSPNHLIIERLLMSLVKEDFAAHAGAQG
jgi:hypothetical protein